MLSLDPVAGPRELDRRVEKLSSETSLKEIKLLGWAAVLGFLPVCLTGEKYLLFTAPLALGALLLLGVRISGRKYVVYFQERRAAGKSSELPAWSLFHPLLEKRAERWLRQELRKDEVETAVALSANFSGRLSDLADLARRL